MPLLHYYYEGKNCNSILQNRSETDYTAEVFMSSICAINTLYRCYLRFPDNIAYYYVEWINIESYRRKDGYVNTGKSVGKGKHKQFVSSFSESF